MALNKRQYVDGQTIVTASNLNEIQDCIITLENNYVPKTRTVAGKALSSNITLAASDVGAVPTSRTINAKALTGNITLSAADVGAVPVARTVNGKALSSNITLSAADVSAVPTTRKVNSKALSQDISLTASDVGAVPTGRKVNGKALSSDITLAASDVSAVPTGRTVNGKALSADITLASGDIGDDSDAGGATVKASLSLLKGSLNAITPFDTSPTNGSAKGIRSDGVFDFFRNAKRLENGEDLNDLYGDGSSGFYFVGGNVLNAPFNYCGLLVIGQGARAGFQIMWQYYGAIAFRDHTGNPAVWRDWTYLPEDPQSTIHGTYNEYVNNTLAVALYASISNNTGIVSGYFNLATATTSSSTVIGSITLNRKITNDFYTSSVGANGSLTRIKIHPDGRIILERPTPAGEWFSFSIPIMLRDKFR